MTDPFRMTRQAYLILLSLVGERRHGYAVIQAVVDLSAGDVRLAAGTLYGNLDRLLAAGLVEGAGEEVVDGRQRRYYRATEAGAQAARAETLHLAQLAARAQRVLDVGLRGPGAGPVLGGA